MEGGQKNGDVVAPRRWLFLVASALVAVLIGLACGLCESSTKRICTGLLELLLLL